ncbi:MAG: hypothetical protein ABR981_00125 [Candidatus Micrarchaeaceae archaeon]|jgi:hypothetical protein
MATKWTVKTHERYLVEAASFSFRAHQTDTATRLLRLVDITDPIEISQIRKSARKTRTHRDTQHSMFVAVGRIDVYTHIVNSGEVKMPPKKFLASLASIRENLESRALDYNIILRRILAA